MTCNKKDKEEIMVEVAAEANEVKQHDNAWRIFLDACLLDDCRRIPYSIHKVYLLLGFMWNNSQFLFYLCINDCNKLLELKRKLEFREFMYSMTGMGGDMCASCS